MSHNAWLQKYRLFFISGYISSHGAATHKRSGWGLLNGANPVIQYMLTGYVLVSAAAAAD